MHTTSIKDTARIAAIIAKAVAEYLKNDQKASYPLTGDVWLTVRCKRVASRLKDGFTYMTQDGALFIRKVDEERIKLVAHAFPRSKRLWNGPDVIPNNELASMFASLFHDLIWGHRRELAEAMGIEARDVLTFGSDVFFIAWRAIDPSFLGRIKSWLAYQGVRSAEPWYHRWKEGVVIAASALLLGGCSGCYTTPDGEVEEMGGVDIVKQIMHDYGDGLGPDPTEVEE